MQGRRKKGGMKGRAGERGIRKKTEQERGCSGLTTEKHQDVESFDVECELPAYLA